MKIYITDNHKPALNLSIEHWLLSRKDLFDEDLMFLYQNSASVIIGRFQNPWLECDLPSMAEKNTALYRRESGGGAVYHDLGNTNFTFISNKKDFIKNEKTGLIIRALKSLGIEATEGDRSDIYVNNRKISGSASKYSSSRVLHHGTLLISADLVALNKFLITREYKSGAVQSRGIASIRSKVANLNEFNHILNHNTVCDAIVKEAQKDCSGPLEIIVLNESELMNINEVQIQKKTLSDWDWLYGKTPSFTINAPLLLGGIQVNCQFHILKGIVKEINYTNDVLDPQDTTLIENNFIDKKCDKLMQLLNVISIQS